MSLLSSSFVCHSLLLLLVAAFPAISIAQTTVEEAAALSSRHQPGKAAELLTPYLANHPDNFEALILLASIRIDLGDSSEAEQLLHRALAASPNSPQANNTLGDLFLRQHRYPEAMDCFETVLSTNRRDATARRGELAAATALALQARATGDQAAALKCLQHARENLPDDPTLLTDLGIQAQSMKLLSPAAEALTAALALKADDLSALYALARVETDQQHFPAAEKHFRAYLAARPDDASAHYGLGRMLEMELRTGEAKAEFERSIALQPVQTESYYQLGQIALDGQHDAEAEPLFRKVLARDANHGGALTGMGVISYRAKDYVKAAEYLAKAVAYAPDYQPAHYYYSLTLAHTGKKQEAEHELKIAASLQEKHAIPAPGNVP